MKNITLIFTSPHLKLHEHVFRYFINCNCKNLYYLKFEHTIQFLQTLMEHYIYIYIYTHTYTY